MDALRCPPGDTPVNGPLRRRAAARRPLPAAAAEAGHPAARRADQPPRRRDRRLAGAPPAGLRRHGHRRDPRPLLPGQRRRLDPGARPRPGHPLEGQLLLLARAEEGAPAAGGEVRGQAPEDAGARAGVDPHEPQGAPGQGQGAHHRLREPAVAGQRQAAGRPGDLHPARPAPGQRRDRGRRRHQGLRRPAADRERELQPAARRHRRHHRPQRRRQDDPLPHDHRPGNSRTPGRSASARRCKLAYVDQSRDSLDPEQDGLGGDHRRAGHARARQASR